MFNPVILWFLLLPLGSAGALWYFNRSARDAWIPSSVFGFVGMLIVLGAFGISSSVATSDIEIWNGQVQSKHRVHGTYEQSYSCNCRSVSSGSGKDATTTTVCDTCYETHYTVRWDCQTTIGEYEIQKLDSTRTSVYASPDPARFTTIQLGDPAAKQSRYTNYIQAVPNSLFTPSAAGLKTKFAALLPKYPDDVFDLYRLNRFITPGYNVPEAAAWNADISNMLRALGPKKQVNAIVVIAKTDDPNYEYALRDAWEGANKNDVVLIIGSKTWPQIDFVRVLSWTKAEAFKIELRDTIQGLGTIQRTPILSTLEIQIAKNFVRRKMSEFEYLKNEIDPPTWVLALTAMIILCSGCLLHLYGQTIFGGSRRPKKF